METLSFGKLSDGREITQYIMKNENGLEVRCINYGCRLTNIYLPDKKGGKADIIQGFDTIREYEADTSFQGAAVGRYGNRIAGASFTIDGKEYKLEATEAPNFLHGNFSSSVFKAQIKGDNSICFSLVSPNLDQGFPGELSVEISYTITDTNELLMDYRAVSTENTHVCLTNHSYFNLSGELDKTIYDQTLMLNAASYLDIDDGLIPSGNLIPVDSDGGEFDFRTAKAFGEGINSESNPQIKLVGGYDHCFVFDKKPNFHSKPCAVACHPESGRKMLVYTSEPAVQLYTTNGRPIKGKNGKLINTHSSFCLETQHYPNSPNEPSFPSTLLRKGDKYHSITLLQFEF